jgi:hypothetical protein
MTNLTGEYLHWHDQMYRQLRGVASKHGFSVSTVAGHRGIKSSKTEFADFIINLDEANMIGLKLNVPLAVKPFQLFPFEKYIGLDELDELLQDWAVADEVRH